MKHLNIRYWDVLNRILGLTPWSKSCPWYDNDDFKGIRYNSVFNLLATTYDDNYL